MNNNLEEFIKNNDCDFTNNLITEEMLKDFEKEIGIEFGPELKTYITKYGYLGFESVEFYGINSNQKNNSDLITQTKYLHENNEISKQYIAIRKESDSIYILIDPNDNIYKLNILDSLIKNLDIKLFDYILETFKEENN